MKKVLMYSGGLDSWLIDKLWKPDVKVFFNIGTENNKRELERVKLRDDVEIIDLPLAQFEEPENNYFLPLRNLHFVVMASHYGDEICLGATGSSTHYDKNDVFKTLSENVINYLLSENSDKRVKIVLPYKDRTKTEMLKMFIDGGGDINEAYNSTVSCYNPDEDGTPCMKCTSCFSKFVAFYKNGYQFTEEEILNFIEGVKGNEKSKGEAVELAYRLELERSNKKKLLIDFDNTITTDSEYPVTGELKPNCLEALELLKEKYNYQLIIYSSRDTKEEQEDVKNFCRKHKLPIDDYIFNKPRAEFYIDDRNIDGSQTWTEIYEYLKGVNKQ